MRVISGSARRMVLAAPTGQDTRPTADRVKENIFNIISPHVQDASFLDLFCGSGAMGIEALSRGAARAVFVDSSSHAIATTQANLAHTRLAPNAKILPICALTAIAKLAQEGNKFDIIFLDAPYRQGLAEQTLAAIAKHNILAPGGIVATECAKGEPTPHIPGLTLTDTRKYGNTRLILYTT